MDTVERVAWCRFCEAQLAAVTAERDRLLQALKWVRDHDDAAQNERWYSSELPACVRDSVDAALAAVEEK